MEVMGVCQVGEVEILPARFCDRSGIGEDIAPGFVMQDHSEACGDCAGDAPYLRHAASALLDALDRQPAELIVADASLKADAAAKGGEIVRHDGGRRAQCKHHAVSEA